jgi:hypothetical protein
MEHYAEIDVSLESSSVCVVDASGRIVREAKVASEPAALIVAISRRSWCHSIRRSARLPLQMVMDHLVSSQLYDCL